MLISAHSYLIRYILDYEYSASSIIMTTNDEVHNYEGLLLTSTTSNKRSLTNHFFDYVKKTKYFVPCTLLSPSKTSLIPSVKDNPASSSKKSIEQPPKRGISDLP